MLNLGFCGGFLGAREWKVRSLGEMVRIHVQVAGKCREVVKYVTRVGVWRHALGRRGE